MNRSVCDHFTCKKLHDNKKCIRKVKELSKSQEIFTGRVTADLNMKFLNSNEILKKIEKK